MLARSALLRRAVPVPRRGRALPRTFVSKNPHKRALSKRQLEGTVEEAPATAAAAPPRKAAAAVKEAAAPPPPPSSSSSGGGGGGSSTRPADVAKATAASGGGDGGGGVPIFPLLLLGGVGLGGAYYNRLIPEEYLHEMLQGEGAFLPKKDVPKAKVEKGLREAVDEATKAPEPVAPAQPAEEEPAVEEEAPATANAPPAPEKEEEEAEVEEEVSLEHPEGGSRVDIDKISAFYQTVNEGRAKQAEEGAREAAARATEYNEAEDTQTDPMSAVAAAADAMAELQSTASLQNSQTLAAAKTALRSDLDAEHFADLESLSAADLRVRVVQLASEMSDRTKWEAVRLKEFLAMKEKEVGDRYMEILQKQRLEFEDLMAQKLREQEDGITRQANAALAAKEEGIQGRLKATSEAREQEMKELLEEETKRISSELELQYETKFQNGMAQAKQAHAQELSGHVATMEGLRDKLVALESRLEVSRAYESGSRRAHRVSAAALALANKLEAGEGAAVELAALRGAAGDGGGAPWG
ncbi:hypothetical protein ACHAWF_010008 [Thalassiosira exigua]